ncbi:MAG TPA: hypothetical protein VGV68_11405 [Terriglobia bacterium]|nr:hypothetical protein [Terriglobia bacterium]
MKQGDPSRRASRSSLIVARWPLFLLLLVFYSASVAAADELSLKDGRKISGTIVGFENGMFRLETEFGFILVRRDKVASIKVTAGAAKESPQKAEARGSANGPSGNATGKSDGPRPEGAEPASERRASPGVPARIGSPPTPGVPQAPPVSRLLNEPPPAHMAEHEEGNNYFNDTFHFVMYKPPDWKFYHELPRGKVSALVALASEDEQTVLFVDRQVWSGMPDLKNDIVESNLRTIYQDYKKLSESETQIDGHPAIRRDFSGLIDGAEWHGVAVSVVQGSTVYGIVGMTSAETFQFQEAVFNKIVKSFHFLPSTSQATAAPRTP